jgi:hypothetical protein
MRMLFRGLLGLNVYHTTYILLFGAIDSAKYAPFFRCGGPVQHPNVVWFKPILDSVFPAMNIEYTGSVQDFISLS